MEEGTYLLGDGVRLRNLWKTPNATTGLLEPTDPTTVTLRIELPTPPGTVTAYTYPTAVSKVSTGLFEYVYVPAVAGRFTYRWEGTGAAQGAEEGTFVITASQVI